MGVDIYVDRVEISPPEKEPWLKEAACLDADPEAFFPNSTATVKRNQAISVCVECPVRLQCLAYALSHEKNVTRRRYGIFGGLDGPQRWRLQQMLDKQGGQDDA